MVQCQKSYLSTETLHQSSLFRFLLKVRHLFIPSSPPKEDTLQVFIELNNLYCIGSYIVKYYFFKAQVKLLLDLKLQYFFISIK